MAILNISANPGALNSPSTPTFQRWKQLMNQAWRIGGQCSLDELWESVRAGVYSGGDIAYDQYIALVVVQQAYLTFRPTVQATVSPVSVRKPFRPPVAMAVKRSTSRSRSAAGFGSSPFRRWIAAAQAGFGCTGRYGC